MSGFIFIFTSLTDFYLNYSLLFEYRLADVCGLCFPKGCNAVKDSLTIIKSLIPAALVKGSIIQRRYCSNKPAGEDFYEWLRGLTDGEGSFMLLKQGSYNFKFQIQLHIDDLEVLYFIQKMLGMGKVYINGTAGMFCVRKQEDVAKIIEIFSKYSLNTFKFLNFLDFKKAFEIYTSSRLKTPEMIKEVEKIRCNMNSQRFDFSLPESYKIRITSNWILGFVEGEGSFSLRKDYNLTLSIGQSIKDLALMKAIKDFFDNLGKNGCDLNDVTRLSCHSDGMVYLTINRLDYITKVLIPFFDTFTLRSKKEKDYKDWKTVLKLRNLGLHYTEKGLKVINLIISQMNNYRLSSNKCTAPVDRALLQVEIDTLLNGPSNFEKREDGRIFIKSLDRYYTNRINIKVELKDENGNLLNTFDSMADCAKYLGISPMTVAKRIQTGKPVLFENKSVYVNKVE